MAKKAKVQHIVSIVVMAMVLVGFYVAIATAQTTYVCDVYTVTVYPDGSASAGSVAIPLASNMRYDLPRRATRTHEGARPWR